VTTSGSKRTVRAYLDSSALVKLVVREPESEALSRAVSELATQTSSELAVVEVGRRARRHGPGPFERARSVMGNTTLRPLDRATLDHAAALEPAGLRSLDAIHLATALSLEGVDLFISYDDRLNEAAARAGLRVESPA
jgi:uncharacterized protein